MFLPKVPQVHSVTYSDFVKKNVKQLKKSKSNYPHLFTVEFRLGAWGGRGRRGLAQAKFLSNSNSHPFRGSLNGCTHNKSAVYTNLQISEFRNKTQKITLI